MSACGPDPIGLVCTGEFVPGIVVEVRDAATREPAGFGASGFVRDGSFVDSLRVSGCTDACGPGTALSLRAAGERPGTYEVFLNKPGYRSWHAAGVRVTKNVCHVNTVTLKALLEVE